MGFFIGCPDRLHGRSPEAAFFQYLDAFNGGAPGAAYRILTPVSYTHLFSFTLADYTEEVAFTPVFAKETVVLPGETAYAALWYKMCIRDRPDSRSAGGSPIIRFPFPDWS